MTQIAVAANALLLSKTKLRILSSNPTGFFRLKMFSTSQGIENFRTCKKEPQELRLNCCEGLIMINFPTASLWSEMKAPVLAAQVFKTAR